MQRTNFIVRAPHLILMLKSCIGAVNCGSACTASAPTCVHVTQSHGNRDPCVICVSHTCFIFKCAQQLHGAKFRPKKRTCTTVRFLRGMVRIHDHRNIFHDQTNDKWKKNKCKIQMREPFEVPTPCTQCTGMSVVAHVCHGGTRLS